MSTRQSAMTGSARMKTVGGQKYSSIKYGVEKNTKMRGGKYTKHLFDLAFSTITDNVHLKICWHRLSTALANCKWQDACS